MIKQIIKWIDISFLMFSDRGGKFIATWFAHMGIYVDFGQLFAVLYQEAKSIHTSRDKKIMFSGQKQNYLILPHFKHKILNRPRTG